MKNFILRVSLALTILLMVGNMASFSMFESSLEVEYVVEDRSVEKKVNIIFEDNTICTSHISITDRDTKILHNSFTMDNYAFELNYTLFKPPIPSLV